MTDRKIIESSDELEQPDHDDTSAGEPPVILAPEGADIPESEVEHLEDGPVE